MIRQTTAYQVGEMVFPTIQQAQKKEILDLIMAGKHAIHSETEAATFIIDNTDEIVAILTCKPTTKKPRSDKGKKRTPKTPAPEQP